MKKASPYTTEQMERILNRLALYNGNATKAAAQLKTEGLNIPVNTLRDWKTRGKWVDRYQEIQTAFQSKTAERMASENEELAFELMEGARETHRYLVAKLPNMNGAELANALRSIYVSLGIAVDKSSLLRGRPTQITERIDPTGAVRELARALGREDILEATAEDITDRKELES